MDDLLREFLAETGQHLDTVELELVRLERNPDDAAILRNVFRLVHTIKGTCGFLGLPRIEALAHAAETLMGQMRGGTPTTSEAVSLILASIDRLKLILAELDRLGAEPAGSDLDLIHDLEAASGVAEPSLPVQGGGTNSSPGQVLLRPLRPGEVSLDELEGVFRSAPGPALSDEPSSPALPSKPVAQGPGCAAGQETSAAPSRGGSSVRVPLETLEHLTAAVSELVLTRNQLLDLTRRDKHPAPRLAAPLQRLSQVTTELQDGIMKTRMQPIGAAWSKLPRLVRDLSAELGKNIDLVLTGSDTELDRQVLDMIRDPLTHMVRNSAAHGIESPAERRELGKPERGTIRLHAYQEEGGIVVELSDDGRGLDLEAIRRRAVELEIGSGPEIARMADEEAVGLIFRPGLSTSSVVGSISGRGVGMDVVRTNVDHLGGAIEIASQAGQGTTARIRLPLTLAIMGALIVEVAGQRFAVPQSFILELVRVGPGCDHRLQGIQGATVLNLRDGFVPVLDLAATLWPETRPGLETGFVVVLQLGPVRLGLSVDALLETEEVVVKPVSARLRSIGLFSGTTLLGDGSVVLILEPKGLARRVGLDSRTGLTEERAPAAPALDRSANVPLLLLRGRDLILKAVPLSLVYRLEEIETGSVELAGGRATLQYRGRLMPLVGIDDATGLRRDGLQPVVVIWTGSAPIGVLVEEVVDIADVPLSIEPVPCRPDLLGTAIVRGRATEIVDLMALLPAGTGSFPAADAGTVLVVEEDALVRHSLSRALEAAGYRVSPVADADEALALLLSEAMDAVVTSIELRGRCGLDLADAMRRHRGTARIPVIACAERPDGAARTRARSLGVAEIVSKFDRAGILSALSGAMRPQDVAA